jgi:hypothetical protein
VEVYPMPDMSNPSVSYPKSAVMFHRYAKVLVGNALLVQHDADHDFAGYVYQNPGANGDTFACSFSLSPGTYTLNVLGITFNTTGKVDWYIDDVLVVSGQDWYSVGVVYAVVKTAAVTVIGHGRHTLKGVINGRNVASTGWLVVLTAISLF